MLPTAFRRPLVRNRWMALTLGRPIHSCDMRLPCFKNRLLPPGHVISGENHANSQLQFVSTIQLGGRDQATGMEKLR
jgi:hypothetical protein